MSLLDMHTAVAVAPSLSLTLSAVTGSAEDYQLLLGLSA
jgi:hypothetical protein